MGNCIILYSILLHVHYIWHVYMMYSYDIPAVYDYMNINITNIVFYVMFELFYVLNKH